MTRGTAGPLLQGGEGLSEAVLPAAVLARTLGAQYLVGGLLVLLWLAVPTTRPDEGAPTVTVLAVLSLLLGAAMTTLSLLPLPVRLHRAANHTCISSAQVVIAVGFAATEAYFNPLLLFLLWTTPYAGVFSRRARWLHVVWTAAVLTAGAAAAAVGGVPAAAAGVGWLATLATVVVTTLLVARVADALQRQALTDPLTGLPNRRAFSAACDAVIDEGTGVAVLLIDLDRFKHVNDTWGHAAGDALLLALAPRLRGLVRGEEVVARLGGDEFAVLLTTADQTATLDEALAAARRLAGAWASPLPLEHGQVVMTASTGVAVGRPGVGAATLLREADAAMYRAKERGNGEPAVFEPELQRAAGRRLALESALRLALRSAATGADPDAGLQVHYQPVLDERDGRRVTAVEALLRCDHPELGEVPPDELVPLAELTGCIEPLGALVLERAVRDLAAWRAAGLVADDLRVAVNVSAQQLDDRLPGRLAALLERTGLPARCLGVEVTETAVAQGPAAERALLALHRLGVSLLLDDFGSGHSSLAQLRRFPVDVLKIDRGFVAGLACSEQDRSVVRAVLPLAEALDLAVVAEGVETLEQHAALRAMGCTRTQGWLHAGAVPASALPDLLQQLEAQASPGPAGAGRTLPGWTTS